MDPPGPTLLEVLVSMVKTIDKQKYFLDYRFNLDKFYFGNRYLQEPLFCVVFKGMHTMSFLIVISLNIYFPCNLSSWSSTKTILGIIIYFKNFKKILILVYNLSFEALLFYVAVFYFRSQKIAP